VVKVVRYEFEKVIWPATYTTRDVYSESFHHFKQQIVVTREQLFSRTAKQIIIDGVYKAARAFSERLIHEAWTVFWKPQIVSFNKQQFNVVCTVHGIPISCYVQSNSSRQTEIITIEAWGQ